MGDQTIGEKTQGDMYNRTILCTLTTHLQLTTTAVGTCFTLAYYGSCNDIQCMRRLLTCG